MVSLLVSASAFGFQNATVAWKLGDDSSVAFVADSGARVGIFVYAGGELVQQGLILGQRGWMVDLNLMEYAAQEEHFKTPWDLVNYWCTHDPVSAAAVFGHGDVQAAKVGTEEYGGVTCDAYDLTGEDSSVNGKLLRWGNLTLFYEMAGTAGASLLRLDLTSPIPPDRFTLPPGVSSAR